jgi:uncharacterized protein involved in exopolysaccharide biosynthesis
MSTQTEGRTAVSGPPPVDPDAEREIDLRGVWEGIKRQWWVMVAGVAAGILVGAVYSVSGGSLYEATARIAPGQAFNPGGSQAVQTYRTNLDAIRTIATSETTMQAAAARLGISPAQLRGRISVAGVTPQGGETTNARSTVLVEITARMNRKKRAQDAANAVAEIVRQTTTTRYIRASLKSYATRIKNFNARLATLQERITNLDDALRQPGLSLDEKLLLAIQLDQSQATLGQTTDSLSTAQLQQILAQDVMLTQIVQEARASKTSARSRRTSIIVGAVIGLIGGLIAAIIVDRRANRARPA